MKKLLVIACVAASSAMAAPALGQGIDEADIAALDAGVESPERFALELRVGPYKPDVGGNAFSVFEDDIGPWIGAEFDVVFFRIPYVGLFGAGAAFGWSEYSGRALAPGTDVAVSEDTVLTLFPVSGLGVLRVDVLSRQFGIPFVFAGKLGVDAFIWDTDTGETDDANNVSWGMHWAAQVALELDFLDRHSARTLDEEWGINHSFLFFEVFGTTADSNLRLRPENGWAWAAGLGLIL